VFIEKKLRIQASKWKSYIMTIPGLGQQKVPVVRGMAARSQVTFKCQ